MRGRGTGCQTRVIDNGTPRAFPRRDFPIGPVPIKSKAGIVGVNSFRLFNKGKDALKLAPGKGIPNFPQFFRHFPRPLLAFESFPKILILHNDIPI
jgi:hypothetical protein